MKNAQPALAVSLKDVGSAYKIELFFDTLAAADVTAGGLKMKRVARNARIGADQHNINGASFNSIRVSGRKYSLERRIAPKRPGSARPIEI
jgi:hypothetical protein